MTTRFAGRASLGLLAVMTAASLWAWGDVPGGVPVPVHFDAAGSPDGFAPPGVALFLMPAAAVLTIAAFVWARGRAGAGSAHAYAVVWLAVVAVLALAHGVILTVALGGAVAVTDLMALAAGAVMIVTGNVAGKIRANTSFGVRTPWTLADAEVWDRTHRFYGVLSVLCGVVLVLLPLADAPGPLTVQALGLSVLVQVMGSAAYSYWIWRGKQR